MLAGSLFISSSFVYAQKDVFEKLPELSKEQTYSKTKKQGGVYVGKSVIGLRWDNGGNEIRIGGFLQVDTQPFFGSDAGSIGNDFFLRRAQSALDLRFGKVYGFHIMPVLAGSPGIPDAYVDGSFMDSFKVRLGKFRPSFGLERLQSATALAFNERAFLTNLVHSPEIGGQIYGEGLGRTAEYHVGVFSGTVDNSDGLGHSAISSNSGVIDFAGRVFARPFQNSDLNLTKGLGLAIAYSYRTQHSNTEPGNSHLPIFRSPGQQSFTSYSHDAFVNDGERIFPQFYYHNGPFGMLGEYILSQQVVARGSATRTVGNDAFQVQLSWVVSNGNSSLRRASTRNSFDRAPTGTLGRVQLVTRYSELSIGHDAFTEGLLRISNSARKAKDFGVGMNWYLNRNTKLQLNYDQTIFEGGAPAGADRPDEKVLLSRMQIAF